MSHSYELLILKQGKKHYPVLEVTEWFESNQIVLNSPENAVDFINNFMVLSELAEEHLFAIPLDTKLNPLGLYVASKGTAVCTMSNFRGVCLMLLLRNATKVILVHNHPSGCVDPSTDDITSYNRYREGLNLLDIEVMDFIIAGKRKVNSLRRSIK